MISRFPITLDTASRLYRALEDEARANPSLMLDWAFLERLGEVVDLYHDQLRERIAELRGEIAA